MNKPVDIRVIEGRQRAEDLRRLRTAKSHRISGGISSEIKGVSHQTIVENVREGIVQIPTTGEAITVRMLDAVLVLAGKIRNAVDIEQDPAGPPSGNGNRRDLGYHHIIEDFT